MLYLFLLYFLILIISPYNIFGKTSKDYIISFLTFTLIFAGVSDTADRDQYIFYFEHPELIVDFLFSFLSYGFNLLDMTYDDLYKFHILLYSIFYVYFISKFCQNTIFTILLFILVIFVPLANQLRFFLGFIFGLLSLYQLSVSKSRLGWFIFFILSFCSHSSLIILQLFSILNRVRTINTYILSLVVLMSFSVLFIYIINSASLGMFSKFSIYTTESRQSGLSGGLFVIFPYIIFILLLLIYTIVFVQNGRENDVKENFLVRLGLFPLTFVPLGVSYQIVSHRFIHPFIIIWFILLVRYVEKTSSFRKYFNYSIVLVLISLLFFVHKYFGIYILTGDGLDAYFELERSILSNQIFSILFK